MVLGISTFIAKTVALVVAFKVISAFAGDHGLHPVGWVGSRCFLKSVKLEGWYEAGGRFAAWKTSLCGVGISLGFA